MREPQLLIAGLVLCGLGACSTDSAEPRRGAEAGPAPPDGRILWLIEGCASSPPFTANTSDLIPALVDKLEKGERDPLQKARTELGRIGERAIPELERFIDERFAERFRSTALLNALDVLQYMDTPAARPLILRCVKHPRSDVRNRAVRALVKHARPDDWELLQQVFELAGTHDEQSGALQVMHAANPARFEQLIDEWLRTGQYVDLWRLAVARIADTTRGASVDHFRAAWPEAPLEIRAALAACAASGGQSEALDYLRLALKDENPTLRTSVCDALERTGRVRELGPVLLNDDDPALRAIAAGAVGKLPPDEETQQWLRSGLNDYDEAVRSLCLEALVAQGDKSAIDEAIVLLDGERADMSLAVKALRPRMAVDPELALRVFERLKARYETIAHRPYQERIATIEALGLVPREESARYLMSLVEQESGDIRDMSAHRHFARQVGNSGAPGRLVLLERLAEETDGERQMDLLEAVAFDTGETAREALMEAFSNDAIAPHARLFAAYRLVATAPAEIVAPFLKRAHLRVPDAQVQQAIRCLLWRWYG